MTAVAREARVLDCRRAGDYVRLAFEAPEIAAAAEPGQFVELAVEPGGRHLLRRPFSVYRADPDAGSVEVVFDAIGPGTAWLASLSARASVAVVGPLGRGFEVPDGPALLVGGGYGTAPIYLLAERAGPERSHLIVGAATRARLLEPARAKHLGASARITTEDGSAGERGIVTDVLEEQAQRIGAHEVYACGPMPMLAAVSRECRRLGLACRVAVEEFMACGIGVCWTCVLPVRTNGETKMLRSCTDGPVFDGAAVAWA